MFWSRNDDDSRNMDGDEFVSKLSIVAKHDDSDDDEPMHVFAGDDFKEYVLSQRGTMVPGTEGTVWSIDNMKHDSVEEMFDGADAIYCDVRWHFTDMLPDGVVVTPAAYKEDLESEIERVNDVIDDD